jgi:hypothetical protein
MTTMLLQVQVQIPDVPPVFVSTGPPEEIIIFAIIALTIILWPVARALARRLEHKGVADAAHVEELEARVAELEERHLHVAELEERIEFAERVLARQGEAARLNPDSGP